jgi:hypothetical protein
MILLFNTALELFFGKVEEIEVKIVFINSHVSEKIKRTFAIFIMYSTFTSEGLVRKLCHDEILKKSRKTFAVKYLK